MRIIENNEQFLPFCIIHYAQNTGDFDENDNSTRTHVSVNNFFFIHATRIFFEKSNSYLKIMIFTYTRRKLVMFLFSISKYAFTLVFLSILTGKFLIHFSNCFTVAEDNFVSTLHQQVITFFDQFLIFAFSSNSFLLL